MRMLLAMILAVIFALVALMARADTPPKSVVAKVNRDAQRYVDEVTVLIEGFGTGGAIDRKGLENVVALARAEARALAFRRLQGADLNGDGAIGGAELQVVAAAASALARGRLAVYFGQADGDGDGLVTVAELQDYANDVALQAFSTAKAQDVYAVLLYDADHDGRVTVPEVAAAVADLALAAANQREIRNKGDIQRHFAPQHHANAAL